MQLLEFQAKELFREYGISLLDSISSTNIEEGRKHAKELGYPFVIKIQVPVGGRGKAGGIQKCQNDDEFDIKYPQVMDLEIKGEKARAILLEKMADIKKELYLSIFLNRSKRCYTIIASAEGGVEIESVKNQIIKEIGLGDVSDEILRLEKQYVEKDIFIIGGPEIIKQTFNLFKEFYLTRIYGNFNCDKFIDINRKGCWMFAERLVDFDRYSELFENEL